MKKLLLVFFLMIQTISAQEPAEQEEGWSSAGKFQLLFSQSAFNDEWKGGGTSSLAANVSLDYELNYREGSFTWNNKLLGTYGLTKSKGDQYLRKTSDRLEVHSVAGKQLSESYFYYSFFANFRTQFTKGYIYRKPSGSNQEVRTETTRFLSPAYLQFGPGMMWKKKEELLLNFAPATARFIFVHPEFTTVPGYVDESYYGVGSDESSRFEFGASLTAFAQLPLMENVVIENNLSLYSNYLSDLGNIDIDYLFNLSMSINKYLSANLVFQAIYDDNAVSAFQIREVFGAGFNYGF